MKSFLTLLICIYAIQLFATASGHFPNTSIGYGPPTGTHNTSYTINPNGRQSTLHLTVAHSDIYSNGMADVYVNFNFDTSGKNVYIVYTTNGTNPTKTNGTVLNASFSYYDSGQDDRWWLGQIPSIAQGTTVMYIIYISDNTLANAFGRIGTNGYVTTWTEGDNSGFSYSVQAPLPVELISFNITNVSSSVRLHWATASEQNNDRFEIERSADARAWQTLATIPGAGFSTTFHSYEFLDEKPLPLNFYRLRQVDFDQQDSYSKVISIEFAGGDQPPRLSPNPVANELTLDFYQEMEPGHSALIFDPTGKLIFEAAIPPGKKCQFDISQLSPGIYFLKIKGSSGQAFWQERFFKN
ncbi:MAG: T9SS type A sorting domain-containing protein [Bacteroidota bacterium]